MLHINLAPFSKGLDFNQLNSVIHSWSHIVGHVIQELLTASLTNSDHLCLNIASVGSNLVTISNLSFTLHININHWPISLLSALPSSVAEKYVNVWTVSFFCVSSTQCTVFLLGKPVFSDGVYFLSKLLQLHPPYTVLQICCLKTVYFT